MLLFIVLQTVQRSLSVRPVSVQGVRRYMNHYILPTKLISRNLKHLLNILELWFKTCVEREGYFCRFFQLLAGVRQAGVLSSLLSTLYSRCGPVNQRWLPSSLCLLHHFLVCRWYHITSVICYRNSISTVKHCTYVAFAWTLMLVNPCTCIRCEPRFISAWIKLRLYDGDQSGWSERCKYLNV
jgi:hypothetical protein